MCTSLEKWLGCGRTAGRECSSLAERADYTPARRLQVPARAGDIPRGNESGLCRAGDRRVALRLVRWFGFAVRAAGAFRIVHTGKYVPRIGATRNAMGTRVRAFPLDEL